MGDRWAPREGRDRGRDRDRSRSPRRDRGDHDHSKPAKNFDFMNAKNALFDERESGSFETFERGAKRRESPERWGHDKFKNRGDDDEGEDALKVWERERKDRIRKLKQEGNFRGGRFGDRDRDRGKFSSKDRKDKDSSRRGSPERRGRRWDSDREKDRPRGKAFDGNSIPLSEEERGKREKRAGRFRRSHSSSSSRSASPKRSSARENKESKPTTTTDGQPTSQESQPEVSSS